MDFCGAILVLFRRWYITLPAFVLACTAAGAMYVTGPISYTSSSVLVLTVPTSGATQRGDPKQVPDLTNPLLNFDQGLSDTAAILIQALSTAEVSDQLGVHPGSDPTFQVTNGSSNPELLINGPLIVITTQSTSPGKAQDLAVRVVQRARQELVNRQQQLKAPTSTYIVLFEAVPPTIPQMQIRTRLRPIISTLALSCIASVAAAFGAESIATRPGRRRRPQSGAVRRTTAGTVVGSGGNEAAQTGSPEVVTTELRPGVTGRDNGREV